MFGVLGSRWFVSLINIYNKPLVQFTAFYIFILSRHLIIEVSYKRVHLKGIFLSPMLYFKLKQINQYQQVRI